MSDHIEHLQWILAFCGCGLFLAAAFAGLGFPMTMVGG